MSAIPESAPADAAQDWVAPQAQWVRVVPGSPNTPFASWLTELRATLVELTRSLPGHGGVLLRDTPARSAAEFEQVAALFLDKQASYVGGVSRRSRIHNNVYNTTHAPDTVVIEQHLEATHTPNPPRTILFHCVTPATTGGETPLTNFAELYDALPAPFTESLQDERVVYDRRLVDREGGLYRALPQRVTASLALSWQEVSGSDDLQRARTLLEDIGYEVDALPRRGLRTRCRQPIVSPHPLTGRMRWYLSDQITRRLPLLTRLPRRLLSRQMGMDFHLESGRRLSQAELDLVHDQIAQLRFSFCWRTGDVLVLDNEQIAHGRNAFTGERLVLTAFG